MQKCLFKNFFVPVKNLCRSVSDCENMQMNIFSETQVCECVNKMSAKNYFNREVTPQACVEKKKGGGGGYSVNI